MRTEVVAFVAICVGIPAACRPERTALSPPAVQPSAPATGVAAPPGPESIPDPTSPSAPLPSASPSDSDNGAACEPAAKIDPGTLSATWPQRIGQRVRLTARVERALDFTDYLVTAKRHRFVVMMAPDQSWEHSAERTFSVLGSTTAALRGRVSLPHLVLEDPESCAD